MTIATSWPIFSSSKATYWPLADDDLFHAFVKNQAHMEFAEGAAISELNDESNTWVRDNSGYEARMCVPPSAIQYGVSTGFLGSGNQLIFDMRFKIVSFPESVTVLLNKGLSTVNPGSPFVFAAYDTGSVVMAVRLSDTTQLSAASATGVVTTGTQYVLRGVYNGEAGSGNDTLAVYLDGVKVASDTTQAAGLAALDNTDDQQMSWQNSNITVNGNTVFTEARIRAETI